MEGTGRKNAAGSWLRWEMLRRTFSVSMLAMAAFGFGIGFMFRGLPALDALDGTIATSGVVAMMSLVCGALYVFGHNDVCRRDNNMCPNRDDFFNRQRSASIDANSAAKRCRIGADPGRPPARSPDVEFHPVRASQFVLVTAADHALAGRASGCQDAP